MSTKQKAEEIYKKVHQMYPNPHTPLNWDTPWQLYVAVVLSAQQTDVGVNKVTDTLFKKYKNLEDYRKAPLLEFEKDVSKINFYKGKAAAIKNAADIIHEKYQGKLPETMEELIVLPFVGRKTANVITQEAFHKTFGIVVDTHVRRLANLFGLTKSSDPVKIEQVLMDVLPDQKKWHDFALGLTYYGREHCTARCKHTDCPLKEYIAK